MLRVKLSLEMRGIDERLIGATWYETHNTHHGRVVAPAAVVREADSQNVTF